MTVDQIIKLHEAGFDNDFIESLMEKGTASESLPEMTEQPEPEKAPEPEQDPAAEPSKDMLKFIAGEFEKLNRNIQNANIINSNINQPKEKTAEDILAEIVAPPRKGGRNT